MKTKRISNEYYYTAQRELEKYIVDEIFKRGIISTSDARKLLNEKLPLNIRNYNRDYLSADEELVCNGTIPRRDKITENLSNNKVLEDKYGILTINIREANRLGYKTPGGNKFRGSWYATRAYAEKLGLPVLDTTKWKTTKGK